MAIDKQLDTLEVMLNMGPQHPATHGVFRMVLSIDGERIVDVEPHIGYLHRGSEKLCEHEQYSQIITLFDRLDYIANFNNELVVCMAAEKLMGTEVPERAQYIRTILCELNRIASHMLFYGTFALDAGAMTPSMYAFRERERIQQIFEATSGARMMHNYFRIGGVKQDVPEDFSQRVAASLGPIKETIEEADNLVTFNEIFLARSRDVGTIDGKTAVALGLTGPNLRASGVDYDVRRVQPYLVYDRLDFNVPLGDRGDCWDRFWLRIREMDESVKIVEQCLAQMETGPIMAPMRRISRPPKGEVYVHAENPRGDLGVYLVSNGGDRPYRLKIRPPSFCNLMSLKHMMRDAYVADAIMVLGSIDIVLGEVDR
ncbi:MAG: NADH-quinone oxidoreductase subunit D [Chloroflexi bacterium]|nr:NADH-quinone oxidoreductase subunit D [Chloroflexota bacterium]